MGGREGRSRNERALRLFVIFALQMKGDFEEVFGGKRGKHTLKSLDNRRVEGDVYFLIRKMLGLWVRNTSQISHS